MVDRTTNWDSYRVERAPELNEQTIRHLRAAIMDGHVKPGDKLTEREVAEWLGTSRSPVHDALVVLEREGLVTTRSDGRYVAMLTERDISVCFAVRRALESLAVELACENITPHDADDLAHCVDLVEQAMSMNRSPIYVKRDLELHRRIWQLADNALISRMLEATIAPILIVRSVPEYHSYEMSFAPLDHLLDTPEEVLGNLRDLVANMRSGNVEGAVANILLDLDRAWRLRKLNH